MSNPFDYVNAINSGKRNENLDPKNFNRYIASRSLSYRYDVVEIVRYVQSKPRLSDPFAYLAFVNFIKPRRLKKGEYWVKNKADKDLETIREYYGCDQKTAHEYYHAMGQEGVEKIKDIMSDQR